MLGDVSLEARMQSLLDRRLPLRTRLGLLRADLRRRWAKTRAVRGALRARHRVPLRRRLCGRPRLLHVRGDRGELRDGLRRHGRARCRRSQGLLRRLRHCPRRTGRRLLRARDGEPRGSRARRIRLPRRVGGSTRRDRCSGGACRPARHARLVGSRARAACGVCGVRGRASSPSRSSLSPTRSGTRRLTSSPAGGSS